MAASYDRRLAPLGRYQDRLRRRAVQRLQLRSGATVLDIGCGTGASFPLLLAAVGRAGKVVGVDQSDGMLAVAQQRVTNAGWPNVELLAVPVQSASLPSADAALFFFTHDLLRTPVALDRVVDAVRPGGPVVAVGARRPAAWLAPLAIPAWLLMRRYVTTSEGLAQPWDLLEERLVDVNVELALLGAIYVVFGNVLLEAA